MSVPSSVALAVLVLVAAVLYSSVGHAGASAYMAAMALVGVTPAVMKPVALVMNLFVAAIGAWRFASRRLVPWSAVVPLCAGSIPAAFVGGRMALPTRAHQVLLGVILLFAAGRLLWPDTGNRRRPLPAAIVLAVIGALLGLAAGLTGVGGGIFLSPLLILAGWEEPRRTAGASVTFILANSAAGLVGHLSAGRGIPALAALLSPLAVVGGAYGSWLGATRLPSRVLRRLLAIVLVMAGAKLLAEGAS